MFGNNLPKKRQYLYVFILSESAAVIIKQLDNFYKIVVNISLRYCVLIFQTFSTLI